MLDNYSWTDFLEILVTTLFLYYGWVAIRYYSADLKTFFGRTGNQNPVLEKSRAPSGFAQYGVAVLGFRQLLQEVDTGSFWYAADEEEFLGLLATRIPGDRIGQGDLLGILAIHLSSVAQAKNLRIDENQIRGQLGID
ncbi:hypothetical protein [Algoriphagus terrigena]|uniref:hypothetical protein n=1 Tax=Algoriphagus terrigena TaxID=344884 RepID=UPI0004220B19|nr:hypothetical protein [Algoriphagus terrigena]